jgi:hypothetical protein
MLWRDELVDTAVKVAQLKDPSSADAAWPGIPSGMPAMRTWFGIPVAYQ